VPAVGAVLGTPGLPAADGQGNLYFPDSYDNVVLKLSTGGTLTVVAGNGNAGYSGDGGPATHASLNGPIAVAVDSSGNLYIADQGNHCVRQISAGNITTAAGVCAANGFSGDGGPATAAKLSLPLGLAVDSSGALYITDVSTCRVRKVSGGKIQTIAGNGSSLPSGDGGPAISAGMIPQAVAVDASGNIYISDVNRVRMISAGMITAFAGSGVAGFNGEGGPATSALLNAPRGIAIDGASVYIADSGNERIRRVLNGTISTVTGNGVASFSGDGGPARSAALNNPYGVAIGAAGRLYISDINNERIRVVSVSDGTITTAAGGNPATYFGDGGPAINAGLWSPQGLAVDGGGNIYFADTNNNCVRKIAGGIITTVAGTGVAGFSGDGGPATAAQLNSPHFVAVDAAGTLYIADTFNNKIRRVSGGTIQTVPATGLIFPNQLAIDPAGNLYVADRGNNRVVKLSGNVMTVVAGSGIAGFSGDGGPATAAMLSGPRGVTLDAAGNLFIADSDNNRIRVVSNGIIRTIAGTGSAGFSGDGGPATAATLSLPWAVIVDAKGNLLISDYNSHRIRKISNGNISTVAGSAVSACQSSVACNGYSGDGGAATDAALGNSYGIALDAAGNLYISDSASNRIREVLADPPSYKLAPDSLTFSAASGGSASTQTISFTPAIPGLAYSAKSDAAWLSVTPLKGSMPGSLQVTADPAIVSPGTYQGNVIISTPLAAPSSTNIAVTFTVGPPAPARLSVGPQTLAFTSIQAGGPQNAQLRVSNEGGGTLAYTATANTTSGGSWLSVSASSGTASSAISSSLSITADPGSLTPGTYQGTIQITGAGTALRVPVTLSVADPNASMLLSQSGLSFITAAQGGVPLPQSFGILNTGRGTMSWSATASVLSGSANWLKISPASGSVQQPYLDVSTVNVSIDPKGLMPGAYYGRILVSGAAVNSPQTVMVLLTVLPVGASPGPEVRPTGLIFTGVAGQSPSSQDVMIGNPKAATDNFKSASIGDSFSYLPVAADVPASQPVTLSVFPDFDSLQPGQIDRGTIALQFADGTPRTISVLTVVAPAGTSSSGRLGPLASACTKTSLELQFRSPVLNSNAVLGQPVTVEAQIVDSCGNLVGPANPQSAAANATFSNKDSDIRLTHIGNGVWSGTWRPVKSSSAPVTISITAFNSNGSSLQSGQQSTTVSLSASVTPTLTAGGVVHAASAMSGVPISPGSLITIYGANLANSTALASTLPLPQQQSGTQVLLGNLPLPILYTSSGQINLQVPFNTPVNTQYQISVQRDDLLSVPEQLVIAAAQPGVFTVNQQGTGQGVIFKSDGVTLAQPGSPATARETVVIYCTGLGAVDPPIPEGVPAPSSPLSRTVNPVTVTIGGQNAPVQFSGLTPGFPGLYQVNAVVPEAEPGDAVPVVVSVAGQTSPTVTLAVQ
jgi:uncharacterized protein (TIGR03437 family)